MIQEFQHLRDAITHLLLITKPVALDSCQNMHDAAAVVESFFERSKFRFPMDSELQGPSQSASCPEGAEFLLGEVTIHESALADADRTGLSNRGASSGNASIHNNLIAEQLSRC